MNGYVCFYNGKRVEIQAASLYAAKLLAVTQLKVPKSKAHMVSVELAELGGKSVVKTADF